VALSEDFFLIKHQLLNPWASQRAYQFLLVYELVSSLDTIYRAREASLHSLEIDA